MSSWLLRVANKVTGRALTYRKGTFFPPDPFAGEPVTAMAGMFFVAETDKCVDKATTRCKPGKS